MNLRFRKFAAKAGVCLAAILGTVATAQSANFSFKFNGSMSCMQPIPVANAPISGAGAGVLNPDGSVTAEITQSAFMFSTSLQFNSKLGSGLTQVPGGTGQVRVVGRNSLKFIWNLPNNSLIVTVNVHGQSCSASFATALRPGKSEYTFFDGSMYHYCQRPVMTSSSCSMQ